MPRCCRAILRGTRFGRESFFDQFDEAGVVAEADMRRQEATSLSPPIFLTLLNQGASEPIDWGTLCELKIVMAAPVAGVVEIRLA